VFTEVLGRYDGDAIDLGAFQQDLAAELSVAADIEVQRAHMILGAVLEGRAYKALVHPAAPDETRTEPKTAAPETDTDSSNQGNDAKRPPLPSTFETPRGPTTAQGAVAAGGETTASPSPGVTTLDRIPEPPDDVEDEPAPPSSQRVSVEDELKTLRARCWTLATRVAQCGRLGDLVIPIHGGVGFLVGPIPVEVSRAFPPECIQHAGCTWWLLALVSEQYAQGARPREHIPAEWADRSVGRGMNQSQFLAWHIQEARHTDEVPIVPVSELGKSGLALFTDRGWEDWMGLLAAYRSILRLTDGDPWR
jgi:hypothetical protein